MLQFGSLHALYMILYSKSSPLRLLYTQLITDKKQEKFEERRVQILKAQIIQLERQVCGREATVVDRECSHSFAEKMPSYQVLYWSRTVLHNIIIIVFFLVYITHLPVVSLYYIVCCCVVCMACCNNLWAILPVVWVDVPCNTCSCVKNA